MLYSSIMCALAGLQCPECNRGFEVDRLQDICQACDSPLLAGYDLAGLRSTLSPVDLARRPSGLWRWAELLPVRHAAFRLTLGEGDTPLLRAARLGERLGLRYLYLKDEGLNPAGTFEARGLAVAVGRAAELGAMASPAWRGCAGRVGREPANASSCSTPEAG
ncbi:MAG: pyridoxal-phosphate dependent enzyme [Chloroflexota bacterium]